MKSSAKRIAKIVGWSILGFLVVAGFALWTQGDTLIRELRVWRAHYQSAGLEKAMKTEVSQLPPVDEVEVYRLSEKPASPAQKSFHRSYYSGPLYEAKKVILKGAEASALADLWRTQTVFHNGTCCHEPHHALRFLYQGKQVSLAIICFKCGNAEIPCTFLGGELIGFGSEQPRDGGLKKRLEELVGAAP